MTTAVRAVARSAGIKFAMLPLSAVLGIAITRVMIAEFGTETFAQYGLLVGLGALLPFADLGMAAVVMNSVGESADPDTDPHVARTIVTAVRMLIASAGVLLGVVLIISLLGAWPTILGDALFPDGGATAAALCLGLVALTLPIGVGQRLLTGLGKNHISIVLQGLQSPIVLLVILLLIWRNVNASAFIPVIPFAATMMISVIALVLAGRNLRNTVGRSLRAVPRIRTVRGTRVFDVAWPMLVQMIALPIAMQTDRLVLSHATDPGQVGRYNLAAQMFIPIWQVTSAAGVVLWPIFAKARAGHGGAPSPFKMSTGFAGMAAVAAIGLGIVSPWLADLASGGEIDLTVGLVVAFMVFMVIQAAKYPLGMFMTDAPGLRFQALMILLMLPVNLGLSLALASRFGAVGPVIGSIVGVFIFQYGANFVYVRRRLRAEIA